MRIRGGTVVRLGRRLALVIVPGRDWLTVRYYVAARDEMGPIVSAPTLRAEPVDDATARRVRAAGREP